MKPLQWCLFFENMEQESFRIMMKDEFIQYTDQCVKIFKREPSLFIHAHKETLSGGTKEF